MADTNQRQSATNSVSRQFSGPNQSNKKSVDSSLGVAASQNHGGLFNKGSKVWFNDGSFIDVDRKSLADVIMQERTNALNYAISQEANDLNYRMFQEQNDYNSTINQKKRILEAGMNPTALLAGQGVEGAASWQGAQTATMQSAQAQGFDPTNGFQKFGQFAQSLGSIASSANISLSAAKQAIDLGTRAAKNAADLDNVKANTKSTEVKTAIDGIQKDILGQTQDAMVQKQQADAETAQHQARLTSAQAAYQELQNMAFPERNKAEIAELAERVALMKEQGLSAQSQRKVFEAEAKKILKDTELVQKTLDWFDRNQIANLGFISAQTNAANASATKAYAEAETQESVRDLNNSITNNNRYTHDNILPKEADKVQQEINKLKGGKGADWFGTEPARPDELDNSSYGKWKAEQNRKIKENYRKDAARKRAARSKAQSKKYPKLNQKSFRSLSPSRMNSKPFYDYR